MMESTLSAETVVPFKLFREIPTESVPETVKPRPIAVARMPEAVASYPLAVEVSPEATEK